MTFEWDPEKRLRNIEKHGIDFADAQALFEGSHVVERSERAGEKRFKATGRAVDRLMTVIYTERGGNVRIISARKARSNERRAYRTLYE